MLASDSVAFWRGPHHGGAELRNPLDPGQRNAFASNVRIGAGSGAEASAATSSQR